MQGANLHTQQPFLNSLQGFQVVASLPSRKSIVWFELDRFDAILPNQLSQGVTSLKRA